MATHKLSICPTFKNMQPHYVLKVDEIRHQDAPPFTTTTPASIPTLFIVNAFGICVHMHLQSRSTAIWRCILKIYTLSDLLTL